MTRKKKSKKYLEILTVVDGRKSTGGAIIHEIKLDMLLGNHFEGTLSQVTKLLENPIILGKSCLDRHNPYVD